MKKIPSNFRTLAICLVLLFGTAFLFRPAWSGGFLDLDDPDYVVKNLPVTHGLTVEGVRWAFTSSASANWHPLTWLSLMLDAGLYGDDPRGFHATNVFLHAVNALLAFLALRRLTRSRGAAASARAPAGSGTDAAPPQADDAFWVCAFCAALYAWHPLRVESVAWVAERKDVLSGFFFFLTLLSYERYARGRSRAQPQRETFNTQHSTFNSQWYYWSAVVLFALGLMSKPMLVTVPFLLLLLDFWPLQRLNRSSILRLIAEKIPFFLLSAGSCAITYVVQKNWGAVADAESLAQRLANAVIAMASYLGDFFEPVGLAVVYALPRHQSAGVIASVAALLAVMTAAVWWQRRRRPWLLIGWFWFAGMLVPVIGLVQVGLQAHADRYTYLPILGLQLALLWTLREASFPLARWLKPVAAVAALGVCVVLTRIQIGYWHDSRTLYEHALAVTRDNYLAECYMGTTLLNDDRFSEAEAHLRKAVELNPDFADARFKLGMTLDQGGNPEAALAVYRGLLDIRSDHAMAEYNLGTVLLELDRPADALTHFQAAVRQKPGYDPAWVALGTASARTGRSAAALDYYRKAIALKPDNAVAQYNLANALTNLRREREALACYERALQIDPNFAEAHCNYADALGTLGRLAEACAHFRRALMLNPEDAAACMGLAVALEDLGDVSAAANCYQRTVALQPTNAVANYNLGTIRLNRGDAAGARRCFEVATRLDPDNDSAWLGLGLAEEKLGSTDAATTDYRRAIAVRPDNAQAHWCLGIALRRAGKTAEAIVEDETALRLNPNFPGLAEQLAQARRELANQSKP